MKTVAKDFKIELRELDKVLKQALTQTYSVSPIFDKESDFKYELFHQLHRLEVRGHKLGDALPGYSTCMLHAEANAISGLSGKSRRADILICDPTRNSQFNYRTKSVIELKKFLNERELNHELEKFAGYGNSIPRLYIASANKSGVSAEDERRIMAEYQPRIKGIKIHDRDTVMNHLHSQVSYGMKRKRNRSSRSTLAEKAERCIKETLNLYGRNQKDPYHSFFWRNYEYETGKGWTFPSEGDFVAQLYHRLRLQFDWSAVSTEYKVPSAPSPGRVDLFVDEENESVGIEVKINYDNFKGKGEKAETAKLSRKFNAMDNYRSNHTNVLVVIQGQDAHKGNNKANTLGQLRQSGSKFGLIYYDERNNKPVGPVAP